MDWFWCKIFVILSKAKDLKPTPTPPLQKEGTKELRHAEFISASQVNPLSWRGNKVKSALPYGARGKCAFTLAETLITLGIIGIVAAIVIPNLIYKYNEYVTVNKVKTFYSKFSNAVHMFQTEQACEEDIRDCFPARTSETYNSSEYFAGIAKYLNVIDSIKPGERITQKWVPEKSYSIKGEALQSVALMNRTNGYNLLANTYLLADGIVLSVNINNANVSGSSVIFDVNGPKGPNRLGKDQFPIALGGSTGTTGANALPEELRNKPNMKKVSPYYGIGDNKSGTWNTNQIGLCSIGWGGDCDSDDISSPTAYVLYHGKLPKFKDFGYPDKP